MIGVGLDMKRRILVIMLVIGILAFNVITVNADDFYDVDDFDTDYIFDSCVKDKTCMVVCNYATSTPQVTIYYDFVDKEWRVSWYSAGRGGKMYDSKTGKHNHVFSDSGDAIYIPKKHTNNNFTCPNYAYQDESFTNSHNEICFDNNGKWCKEDKSNFATDFKDSIDKKYDFNDELKTYFDLWYNNDVKSSLSCNSIYSEENNEIAKNLLDRFKGDMANTFVFNGAPAEQVPSFIINSSSWNYIASTIGDDVVEVANGCHSQTEQAYANGEISAEVYNDRINKIKKIIEVTETEIAIQLDPNKNEASTDYWNQEIECEDIFEFDKEGSVGWMLQTIFDYIKVIGPVIVVLLSAIDFIKAVVGTDEKAMKEAQSKLIIRLVAALALFLIPTLIQLLLNFINVTLSDGCYLK